MIFDKILSIIALVKKVHLFYQDPMSQRNNTPSPYSVLSDRVGSFYNTLTDHSLTVISLNLHFYPTYYLKTI